MKLMMILNAALFSNFCVIRWHTSHTSDRMQPEQETNSLFYKRVAHIPHFW